MMTYMFEELLLGNVLEQIYSQTDSNSGLVFFNEFSMNLLYFFHLVSMNICLLLIFGLSLFVALVAVVVFLEIKFRLDISLFAVTRIKLLLGSLIFFLPFTTFGILSWCLRLTRLMVRLVSYDVAFHKDLTKYTFL